MSNELLILLGAMASCVGLGLAALRFGVDSRNLEAAPARNLP
ncbi:MAG: hypothetical protein QM692_18940 [Thermomicrobiales bacterium]